MLYGLFDNTAHFDHKILKAVEPTPNISSLMVFQLQV